MEKNLMNYSMELALLANIYSDKLINKEEYDKIKVEMMRDYNIVSDIAEKSA